MSSGRATHRSAAPAHLLRAVLEANRRLGTDGPGSGTWGNASGVDRDAGVMVIKASGVPFDDLTEAAMVTVRLDGAAARAGLRPSSDSATHLELYRAFPSIGGIVHTHSPRATAWAQAGCPIPVYGTTHADCFAAAVPCTRPLSRGEIEGAYEAETGRVIVECVGLTDPLDVPAVLVHSHGPFAWGSDVAQAVEAAEQLEVVAELAFATSLLARRIGEIDPTLRRRHFERKHGPVAYYGQDNPTVPA